MAFSDKGSCFRYAFRQNGERHRGRISRDELYSFLSNRKGASNIGSKGRVGFLDFCKESLQGFFDQHQKSSQRRDRTSLNHLLSYFGKYDLHEVDLEKALSYRAYRLRCKAYGREEGGLLSDRSANREITCLRQILIHAVDLGYLKEDLLAKLRRLKEKGIRMEYLLLREIHVLLDRLSGWVRDFVEILIWTGMRTGELLALRRENVNVDLKIITVLNKKSRREPTRDLPMRPRVREILLRRLRDRDSASPLVFCGKDGRGRVVPYGVLRGASKKAGIEKHLRFHDFRHTFAVNHAMYYGDAFGLQEEMGHSSLVAMERYVSRYKNLGKEHSIFSLAEEQNLGVA